MNYTHENVTLEIDIVGREDLMGMCWFQVPKKHEHFFTENCSINEVDPEDFSDDDNLPQYELLDLGAYFYPQDDYWWCTDPDGFIAYLEFLLNEDGPQTVEVQSEHAFWPIHDMFHARFDAAGCTVYVSASIERERLIQAMEVLVENGQRPSYEMTQEIEEAFQARFGETIYLEEYCFDPEEMEAY